MISPEGGKRIAGTQHTNRSADPPRAMLPIRLGRTEYKTCWDLQHRLVELRSTGRIPDLLLLTEHDHVYTLGRTGNEDHLLAGAEELRRRGIAYYQNDRGGDITYHGPGQLVVYPILDLHNYYLDVHKYVRDLEEVVIQTIARFGLYGKRVEGYTGVWVGDEKICAIGIKVSRWVTMHGFALNVMTELSYYDRIIPCGIFEYGVTSMQHALGCRVDMEEVATEVIREFMRVFSVNIEPMSNETLRQQILAGGPENEIASAVVS